MIESDKEVDISLFGTLHVSGHTTYGDTVEELFLGYSHHVHRHLACNRLPASAAWRRSSALLDALAAHDEAHQTVSIRKLIRERWSLRDEEGSIQLNILPKKSLRTRGLCSFLMTFSPQKVKKIDTLVPGGGTVSQYKRGNGTVEVVAEHDEGLVALRSESRLPGRDTAPLAHHHFLESIGFRRTDKLLPVLSHQALASRGKPGSVAVTSTLLPGLMLSTVCLSLMMGPGHESPQASRRRMVEGFSGDVISGL